MDWLTEDLKLEIKQVFESRYKRELSSEEIVEIAKNLTGFIETFSRFKYREDKDD